MHKNAKFEFEHRSHFQLTKKKRLEAISKRFFYHINSKPIIEWASIQKRILLGERDEWFHLRQAQQKLV